MSVFKPRLAPPVLKLERTAFFLDLDGTLAEIVSDPQQAQVSPRTLRIIAGLMADTHKAVAVISGRSLAQLEQMLYSAQLPLAGVHGIERREANGDIIKAEVDAKLFSRLVSVIDEFTSSHEGTIAEAKPGSVALHYRQRPDLEAQCLTLAETLSRMDRRIHLLPGKMVIEMTLAPVTKGDAIAQFMTKPPFSGRTPFFAGDDVTDETGFAAVNVMEGVSVKIGSGETAAKYRLESVSALSAYLEALLERNAMEPNRANHSFDEETISISR